MLLVGLTGGIGAGKSTVARMLSEHGAVVVDADELTGLVMARGGPAYSKVVSLFGREVLRDDGEVDRSVLAARVFADEDARRRLEAAVHPEVIRLMAGEAERYRDTDRIVIFDVPLLVETGLHSAVGAVVVVASSLGTQVARLARERGMTETQVRARVLAQAPSEERARMADFVVQNEGDLDTLRSQVDRLWKELEARRDGSNRQI